MNICELLVRRASEYAQKPLLYFGGSSMAYGAFVEQVNRWSGMLTRLGIGDGDRVVLLARNKPEWLASFFGALGAGAIVVPINPELTPAEVGYIMDHAEPKMAVVDTDLVASLRQTRHQPRVVELTAETGRTSEWNQLVAASAPMHWKPRVDADPALIIYTSGTTGRPKGATLSHGNVIAVSTIVAEQFGITPQDITLSSGPLAFLYPLAFNCLGSFRNGASVILQERFHPKHALRAIEQSGVTIFMGVPTMYTMMLNWAEKEEVDVSSLRLCVSAGASLPWNLCVRFKERFRVPIYDLWGLTEGTPITSYDPSVEPGSRPGSCGRVLPGCQVRIEDNKGRILPPDEIGEVVASSPAVMSGYYKNPEATMAMLRNGWMYTGDLGKLDADGYLYIVGRTRDMIVRGGAKVYPAEVEDVLYGHPAVAECAVIGIPDEVFGEKVKAFIVVKPGQAVNAVEIRQHCRKSLAEYKNPDEIMFSTQLPKGPTGKILKRVLEQQCCQGR